MYTFVVNGPLSCVTDPRTAKGAPGPLCPGPKLGDCQALRGLGKPASETLGVLDGDVCNKLARFGRYIYIYMYMYMYIYIIHTNVPNGKNCWTLLGISKLTLVPCDVGPEFAQQCGSTKEEIFWMMTFGRRTRLCGWLGQAPT